MLFVTTHQYGVDPADLPRKERKLAVALGRDTSKVLTKDELMSACGFATTRELDSAAMRLSAKLKVDGQRAVVNVWGVGYKLADPVVLIDG